MFRVSFLGVVAGQRGGRTSSGLSHWLFESRKRVSSVDSDEVGTDGVCFRLCDGCHAP